MLRKFIRFHFESVRFSWESNNFNLLIEHTLFISMIAMVFGVVGYLYFFYIDPTDTQEFFGGAVLSAILGYYAAWGTINGTRALRRWAYYEDPRKAKDTDKYFSVGEGSGDSLDDEFDGWDDALDDIHDDGETLNSLSR